MAGYTTSIPPVLVTQAITYSGGPRMWVYTTADAATTVDGSGYFSNGGNLGMRVGDFVLVYSTGDGTLTTYRVVTVSSTAPGAVDLSNSTVVGSATNSD